MTLLTVTFKIGDRAQAGENIINIKVIECFNDAFDDVSVSIAPVKINVLDDYIPEYGDMDGDQRIDSRDIVAIRKYIVDGYTDPVGGADVNCDGVVDTRDLILVRQYLANYNYDTGKSTVVLGK